MMLDAIRETGEKHSPKSNFMAEYHVVADNPESLLPLTEDDFHPKKGPQMDCSSYTRRTKFSKTKAVNEDGLKSLKRASTSENAALERETHIKRETAKWSSSDGRFNELAGSISPDLNAQRNRRPSVSPKRCWGRSNRSRSRSPSRGSTFGSKRWENRGRTRGGLIIRGRDFSDSKDGSKRSNWDDMAAAQTTRRSSVTNKEIKGLVPALDSSDDLNRSISPGPEPRRQDIYIINPKHGCSRSERNFISNKDDAKMSNWETASGNQTTNADGYSTRHGGGGWGATLGQFDELDRSISVDNQRWRRQSHSISPKHSWCIRKRSRSRSPSLGLKPGMENWNTRGRTAGRSAAPNRDFATEKLGKGSHFREISEDDAWRHSGNASREFGEGRFERGRYSGYHRRENFNDLLAQTDVSRDRLLQRELSHHDGIWEKHERHQNNRSTDHRYISTKERYPQFSTCNYDHHDGSSRSPWPMRDGARERNYNRRDAVSPFRQRLKSRRVSDTPCKYFAVGQCRRGEDCKFSHYPLHGHPKGRQLDDKQDHNMRIETATSLNGSKLGNGASAMDAPVSSHEMHNGNSSRMSNSSSVDDEVSRKSKDAQSKASQSPEQNTTEDAFEQCDSAVSAAMMIKSTHVEQIISNKEQVSSKGGCAVGDTARSQNEMGSATFPSAAISFTEKSLSRNMSEQPVDPELHSSAPNAQYMKGTSLSPSGKTLQETMCSIPPNGDFQLGISQIPSPTNRQMHPASEVGLSEQIQQSPVSHKNGPSQHIFPTGQSNQQMHSAAQVGHSEQIQRSPLSYKNGLSQSIAHSVVPEGQSNHMFSQDHPNSHLILISDDESEQQADNTNERSSQVTSGTSANQVVVITEEVAHVTDLPSSPSQVCQQPSQLHATLTPIGSAGSTLSEMASEPSMVKLPSPPQGFLVPHHNQTLASDNCCKDARLDENKNRQNGELEAHHNQTPVSDNCHKDVQLGEKENRQNGNFELKQVKPAEEVTVSNKSQNQKVHVPSSEVIEQDAQVDGRNKDTKETNGMKMFKFALVEFVKDQLKPSWKEGHLSREAHKAIVKKVVDKVTSSVQGHNLPQTQQKINLYMEHSKSKLSKLVQAYVARSIKS